MYLEKVKSVEDVRDGWSERFTNFL